MKVKRYLEKYINFSLISNCIVFNTLAGSGKQDGKGKKCSGSGKDKNKSNTTGEGENELSSEELAKKQKEEEERKQKEKKAKEEAEKLAKDKAALDTKKQELIDVIDALVPRITKLNTSGYNDLKINEIITKDQINLANAKTIVDLEDKINKLNDKITKNEETLANYEELKKKKEEDFIPKFNELYDKMIIINSLNGCNSKVNTTIITKNMIDDSKYEDIPNITQKLKNLETEINTKISEIKQDLKNKNAEIVKQKSNSSNPLHDVIKVNYKDQQIHDCIITNLVEIYNDIKLNYDLSQLTTNEAKKYVKDEFKKIENLHKFFVGLKIKTDSEYLEEEYKILNQVDSFTDITKVKFLSSALTSLKNIQNKISTLNKTYNENYKKRYETAISTNNKLSINFIYKITIKNPLGGVPITNTPYNYTHSDIITTPGLINIDCTVTNEKTVDALNAIDGNIKKLEEAVTNSEAAFKENIKNTYNFFINTYGDISDGIKNYALTDDTLDGMIDSIKNLYELVRTEVQKLLKNAETISSAGVGITDEFKNKLKKLKLYKISDDVKSINPSCMEPNNFFNSENKNGDKIKEALKNLKTEIKKCDIIEQRKKIYNRLKNKIDHYKKNFENSLSLFYYRSVKLNKKNEYRLTEPICNNFCSTLTVSDNNITLKEKYFYYGLYGCGDFTNKISFDDIEKILNNFEKIFKHNSEILSQYKDYFKKNLDEIKKLNYDYNSADWLSPEDKTNLNKFFKNFEDIDGILNKYFDEYINFDKYLTDSNEYLTYFFSIFDTLFKDLKNKYFKQRIYFGEIFDNMKSDNIDNDQIVFFYNVFLNVEIYKIFIYLLSLPIKAAIKYENIEKLIEEVKKLDKGKSKDKDVYTKFLLKIYFDNLKGDKDYEKKTLNEINFNEFTCVLDEKNVNIIHNFLTYNGILFNNIKCFFSELKYFKDLNLLSNDVLKLPDESKK